MYKKKGNLIIGFCACCLLLWALLIVACSAPYSTIEYPGYSVSEWFEKTTLPYNATSSEDFDYHDFLLTWTEQGEIEEGTLFEAVFQHPDLIALRICNDYVVKTVMFTYIIHAASNSMRDATYVTVDISACGSHGRWMLVDSGNPIRGGEIYNSHILAHFSNVIRDLDLPEGSILNDPQ